MRLLRYSSFVALGVSLAACGDRETPLAPEADGGLQRVSAVPAQAKAAPQHLVVFRSQAVPSDFADRVEALGGKVEVSVDQLGVASVTGLDAAGVSALRKAAGVQTVELDEPVPLERTVSEPVQVEADAVASPAAPNTAVVFARQWNMRQIQAPAAWAAGHLGSPDVTIAILDTGIDYLSADLAGRVDLARSKSFIAQDDAVVDLAFPGTHHIADLDGHGTNVATQAASNAVYFAGVTSRSTLMGVKVCGLIPGNCPSAAVFGGIAYAVDNGADVINMSLGGGFLKSRNPGFVSVINRAFQYAERAGVVMVVSAGNEARDLDHSPNYYKTYCSATHVICTSATGPTSSGAGAPNRTYNGPFVTPDAPSVYTNYGRSAISVAAPGGNYVLSGNSVVTAGWVWSVCPKTALIYQDGTLYLTICSAFPGNVYANGYAGTSQASPHVSGLVALLAARGVRHPSQIRSAIAKGADDLGQRGTDPYYGKGRINVAKTLGL